MVNELNNLTPVTKKNLKPAAITLAKAFQDYPVAVFFEPDAVKRKKTQPAAFSNAIRENLVHGAVYSTSPKMEGVAVWSLVDPAQPPKNKPAVIQWFRSLFADKAKLKRQQVFFNYYSAVRKRILPERYWYLQILGVDPACQGKGYSSRLIRPMLARADKEGLPVFLETQQKKNVSLYEHFGFKVVEEGTIPGSNVHSWAMVRKPEKSGTDKG